MIDRFRFIVNETWASLRGNLAMQVAAISTACIALILLGSAAMALYKLDALAQSLPNAFEASVFLHTTVSRAQTLKLKAEIEAMPEVAQVVLVPREVAWEQEKQKYKDEVNLADLPNPLPDKLIVRVHQAETLPAVSARIAQSSLVDEVIDSQAELEMVLGAARLVRWVGLGTGGLLLLSALLLIYNAVRLTIHARQHEVQVMALVGATLRSIRLPFVLEGMVQGLLGGIIAALITVLSAGLLSEYMVSQWPLLKDMPPGLPPGVVLVGVPILGMVLGGLCASWATLRYVRI